VHKYAEIRIKQGFNGTPKTARHQAGKIWVRPKVYKKSSIQPKWLNVRIPELESFLASLLPADAVVFQWELPAD
jgi:hypothetical protein